MEKGADCHFLTFFFSFDFFFIKRHFFEINIIIIFFINIFSFSQAHFVQSCTTHDASDSPNGEWAKAMHSFPCCGTLPFPLPLALRCGRGGGCGGVGGAGGVGCVVLCL